MKFSNFRNVLNNRDVLNFYFLLESLNTRSYLSLLGCVSPYQDDFGETLSTVHFVCEAKNIKATPQQNAVITEYQVIVVVLLLKF